MPETKKGSLDGGLPPEVFEKILNKTVYQKARDKMKKEQAADDNADETEKKRDYLEPILTKLALQGIEVLEETSAISVRNEALRSLKERCSPEQRSFSVDWKPNRRT